MIFSSVPPLHLDPTTLNQNQQLFHHQQQRQPDIVINNRYGNNTHGIDDNSPLQPPPPPASTCTARPNSMAERARIAKIPTQTQGAPLPCPRCESSNTKFCYFNNYSLAQPRHFCKACRRYWTRGGALRNVPVGCGTRRSNRGSSSSSSKYGGKSLSAATSAGLPLLPPQQQSIIPPLLSPAMMATSAMIDYENIGLGFPNMGMMNRIQQFPFLGGLEQPSFPFLGGPVGGNGRGGPRLEPELMSQMESVKTEDGKRRKQYSLGMNNSCNNNDSNNNNNNNNQSNYLSDWMANLSGFNSQSMGTLA